MAKFAIGKSSKAISDRSGMEFPYTEMVKEWNGSLVHYSEFEPKHPQIRRRRTVAERREGDCCHHQQRGKKAGLPAC